MMTGKMKRVFRLVKMACGQQPSLPVSDLRPQFLVFPVTYRCNLKCSSCSCPEQAAEVGELDLTQIDRCLSKLSLRKKSPLEIVNLTGGEPFLREDLVSVVGLLADYGVRQIGISSNGFLVEKTVSNFEALLKTYPGLSWSIQLSVDGPESVHNAIRGNPNSFSAVMQTVDRLLELRGLYRFGLSTNLTISRENISNIKDYECYMEERFGNRLSRQYTFAVESELYINSEQADIKGQFRDEGYLAGLRNIAIWLYREKGDLFALDVYLMSLGYRRFTPCVFQSGGYFLEPSGDVYKCSITQQALIGSGLTSEEFSLDNAAEVLKKIGKECFFCANNCGNYLRSSGVYDFLRSEFVKTRKRIYLASGFGDVFTVRTLRKMGIQTFPYSGQPINDDEMVFYIKGSKYCLELQKQVYDHRIHLLPMGLLND